MTRLMSSAAQWLETQADLPEVLPAFHMAQGVGKFRPGEDLVNDGLYSVELDRSIQTFEHFSRPYVDALHTKAVHQDAARFDRGRGATESTDDTHSTAHANGLERTRQSVRAAYLDYV